MVQRQRLDQILNISVIALAILFVGLAAYFGWTVYGDRIAAREANPALRVVDSVAAAVRKQPNDAILRIRLGEAYAAAGRTQQAIEQFNAALTIDPKNVGAYLDLGQVALMSDRFTEAEGYYQKVLDLTAGTEFENINEKREIALFQMGRIALQNKDYEKAIGDFKGALRIRRDASDSYYYLALAFDGIGQTEEAKKQLEMALAFDPNLPQALYYYGQLYMREGDKINASYQFYRAAQADPQAEEPKEALAQFGNSADLIAQARAQMSTDPQAALDNILIARNIDPQNAAAAKLHAEILVARGDTKNALDVYLQAEKLDPKDPAIKAAIVKLTPPPAPAKKAGSK